MSAAGQHSQNLQPWVGLCHFVGDEEVLHVAIQQQMANRAAAQRDKVYFYAHDYNAKDGFILNSPLQVYMRDVRQELDRTRQQFHRLKYRDDTQIADCVNLGEETRKRLDCFYDHTVKNDVPGMRSCSDIYDIYVDPDRYYGGTSQTK